MDIWVFDHALLAGGLRLIDADGFDGPLNYLRITNNTDINVIFSFDGINDHEFVVIGKSIDIMPPLCNMGLNKRCLFKNKTKVYARYVHMQPAAGEIIVQGFYQE